jgi:hypothetical protein
MPGLDAYTKLLLHCNGTNGSSTFTDETGIHTVTAYNTAQVSTSSPKFGSGSLLLDGNSDYLTIPDSDSWDLLANNTDSWAIDCWIYFSLSTRTKGEIIFSQGTNIPRIILYTGTDFSITFAMYENSGNNISIDSNTNAIPNQQWCHIVLCKNADKYGIYVNGVQVAYGQFSNILTIAQPFNIGRWNDGIDYYYLNGNIDEFRVQKSNYFNSQPNIGLSDTIAVPTSEYTEDTIISNPYIKLSNAFISKNINVKLSNVFSEKTLKVRASGVFK